MNGCGPRPTNPMPRGSKRIRRIMRYVEKQIVLQALDHLWREHLVTLDHLRQVDRLARLAQRDPLNEYKSEAFELFDELITRLREVDDGTIEPSSKSPSNRPPTEDRRCRSQ